MSNSLKKEFDRIAIVKSIREREELIFHYQKTGFLDRDDAIRTIQELRLTDKEVATVTAAKLAMYSVPFNQVTNGQIVAELALQRDILLGKFAKIQTEGQYKQN